MEDYNEASITLCLSQTAVQINLFSALIKPFPLIYIFIQTFFEEAIFRMELHHNKFSTGNP